MTCSSQSPTEAPTMYAERVLPVGARYASLHIGSLRVTVHTTGTPNRRVLTWALGLSRAGDLDALGVWQGSPDGAAQGPKMASELRRMGLASVEALAQAGPPELQARAAQEFPGAVVVASQHQLRTACLAIAAPRRRAAVEALLDDLWRAATSEAARRLIDERLSGNSLFPAAVSRLCRAAHDQSAPFWDLAPRTRRTVLRGEELAGRLHAGLSAAVHRTGPFESDDEAALSAWIWLRAALRRIGLQGAPVPRQRRPGGNPSIVASRGAAA